MATTPTPIGEQLYNNFENNILPSYRAANLVFAYYAAFPLVFSPDMLYQLWLNYQDYEECQANEAQIKMLPMVVVSDLLQSGMCQEVAFELYELHEEVAAYLKNNIKQLLHAKNIQLLYNYKDIAAFTLGYAKQYLQHPNRRSLFDIYYWKSLFEAYPEQASEEIKIALSKQSTNSDTQSTLYLLAEHQADTLVHNTPKQEYNKLPLFSYQAAPDHINITNKSAQLAQQIADKLGLKAMETNAMKENKTLIMLINWKWRKMTIVNDKYFEVISEEEVLSTISSPSSNYFTVYDAQTNDANNAKVVATCIYKGEKTNQLLLKITEHLYNKYANAKIYVFMHRGHHHTYEDVQDLLDKSEGKIEKCFLFSEGRDFIYYPTQKKGLLNDAGGFWRQDGINVLGLDEETKQNTIQQPYFDNVWHYYDHEFRKKIYELKQDFFDICMPLTFPNRPTEIAYKQFMDNFMEEAKKQNKELYLRFRSFLGGYDNLQKNTPNKSRELEEYAELKKEWERLEKLERHSERSYILDDCSANLEHILPDNPQDQSASDCYLALKEKIQPLFYPNASKPLPTFVTKGNLQNIRMLFRKLLDCLDGDET